MIQGVPLSRIRSDYGNERHDRRWIEKLKARLKAGEQLPPIIVSAEPSGTNRVVDGEHRHSAYKELGRDEIPAFVLACTYDEALPLRKLDALAKSLDRGAGQRWRLHELVRDGIAMRVSAGTLGA
jgi:ParB-like chromosome segregation protein Spo0J